MQHNTDCHASLMQLNTVGSISAVLHMLQQSSSTGQQRAGPAMVAVRTAGLCAAGLTRSWSLTQIWPTGMPTINQCVLDMRHITPPALNINKEGPPPPPPPHNLIYIDITQPVLFPSAKQTQKCNPSRINKETDCFPNMFVGNCRFPSACCSAVTRRDTEGASKANSCSMRQTNCLCVDK